MSDETTSQIADEPTSESQIAGQIADDPRQPPHTSVDLLKQLLPQIADEPTSEDLARFTRERAGAETDRRINNGRPIRDRNAYAAFLAKTPDFTEESQHVWKHRQCGECGKGYIEWYSPGSGTTRSRCEAKPEIEAEAS